MADEYSVAWRVLDAQYWGVPQRRRRIFLVADFRGDCAGEVLFNREGLRRDFAESRKAWKGITKTLAVCPDAKCWDAVRKWLSNPFLDKAAYTMWGNGVALPCALYVMEGLVEANKQTNNEVI